MNHSGSKPQGQFGRRNDQNLGLAHRFASNNANITQSNDLFDMSSLQQVAGTPQPGNAPTAQQIASMSVDEIVAMA